MKIVDEELESITVAIQDMQTGVFCREDGSMWMRVYLADAQAGCTACCDIENQTLQSLDSRERVTPLNAALHVYGPKGGAIGEPCEDERDVRLRQADEFIQRGARRTGQDSCGWYIYITCWAKGFVAKCPAAQSFSRYHADWIDAVLEIEPAVEKAWAERNAD